MILTLPHLHSLYLTLHSLYLTSRNRTDALRVFLTVRISLQYLAVEKLQLCSNAPTTVRCCTHPPAQLCLRAAADQRCRLCQDTKTFIRGNPVIAVCKGTDTTILNCSEFFHNLNVPSNILQYGYIYVQIAFPVVAANIDFFTGSPLNHFFIYFIVIDEDEERTQDGILSNNVEFKIMVV
jgi:hypothetical protein